MACADSLAHRRHRAFARICCLALVLLGLSGATVGAEPSASAPRASRAPAPSTSVAPAPVAEPPSVTVETLIDTWDIDLARTLGLTNLSEEDREAEISRADPMRMSIRFRHSGRFTLEKTTHGRVEIENAQWVLADQRGPDLTIHIRPEGATEASPDEEVLHLAFVSENRFVLLPEGAPVSEAVHFRRARNGSSDAVRATGFHVMPETLFGSWEADFARAIREEAGISEGRVEVAQSVASLMGLAITFHEDGGLRVAVDAMGRFETERGRYEVSRVGSNRIFVTVSPTASSEDDSSEDLQFLVLTFEDANHFKMAHENGNDDFTWFRRVERSTPARPAAATPGEGSSETSEARETSSSP